MRYIVLIICLCSGLEVFGQGDTTVTIGLKPEIYRRVINQQFTGLITGQTKNFVGNFASLDLKDAEVSLAGNTIFNGGSVLGFKTSGGVTDGLSDVFSNSKLNTKVSIDIQWNVLSLGKRKIQYYDDSFRQYMKKERKIRSESAARILKLERGMVADSIDQKRRELTAEIAKLDGQMRLLRDPNGNISTTNQRKFDSLLYKHDADTALLHSTADEILRFDDLELINDADNSRARQLRNLETSIEIHGFSFGWFSIACGVIISHNHPSGNLAPSEADRKLTKDLKDAGKFLHIPVRDHIIMTSESYYSFADEGFL